MSSAVMDGPVAVLLCAAHAEVDDLLTAELTRLDDEQLLRSWRALESLRNRLAAVEHRFVAEAEQRGLPAERGARNVAALIRGLLRVHPSEAVGRVRAANAAVGRTTLTGEPTAAPFPVLAAAQASGEISPRHARVVVSAVESLPEPVHAEHGERVERELVSHAHVFDPFELGRLAVRITTLLDQDGPEPPSGLDERVRRRGLDISRRPDGSSRILIDATAELTERLLTTLDPLAAPKPSQDGTHDPRSARQRNHDGLLDSLDLLGRTGRVPDVGGCSTTVLLTMTTDAWRTGRGVATTGHGAVIPAREAIRIAGAQARVAAVELTADGAITGWTDPRRLFSEPQRLAMTARDGGCSFPGCDAPPAWCQAHHVVDHARGGPTTVDNGTLLCGFHHREHARQGWRCTVADGRPTWIPPPWIDTDQRAHANPLHRMT